MQPPLKEDLRRRVGMLMVYRVVLITLVLGLTVVLNLASPQELAGPSTQPLFAIIIVTYLLSIAYAFWLPKLDDALHFVDLQLAIDLIITTLLVHLTGGAQSGYTFFYPLTIVGAATVRYRRGAVVVTAASVLCFVAVALVTPEQPPGTLARQLVLNLGACAAMGLLAANLGAQMSRSVSRLEEQRAAAADLSALKEHIIRSLSSGLVTIDLGGRAMTMNLAATEVLGVAAGGGVGMPIGELLPELAEKMAPMKPLDVLRRGEIGAKRADGRELRLGVGVTPLVNHRGEPLGRIINFSDLTELRRMEREVRRAERLAVIGGVAAGVAHEIRNPLQSISGCIELLRSSPQIDGENQRLMEIVLREVDRLNNLLTELLDYARPQQRLALTLDLGNVLDETVRVFAQDRTFARLKTRYAPPSGEIQVEADPAQLRQVVWNLLRNAAEAMPDGGEIGVDCAVDGGWAEVGVSDTGVGITPEEQERIFEPFYTTKPGGNGLGLATVQRIVTEHGGTIALRSEPGRGTRVSFRLPLVLAS